MKKLLSAILAAAMIFTLTACGAPAAEPEPDPEPETVSEPEPEPAAVEGVVKEASEARIVIELADGTALALDTSGIADLDVGPGDTVRVEYTGEIGAMAASRVEVTAKAEMVSTIVTGVVTKVDDEYVFVTLEDGTEAALRTVSMEEGEVEVGDTLTIEYVDGMTVLSVEVTKAEKAEAEETAQDAAAQGTAAGATGATGETGSSSGSGTGGSFNSFLQQYSEWAHQMQEQQGGAVITSDDESGSSEDAGDVYEAIDLINAEREKEGLKKLEINSELMEMAAVRAEEMSERFEHIRPDGSDYGTIFEEFGSELKRCGENGYKAGTNNTASAAVTWWMNSSGHKANILKDSATMIGVGCYGKYWTMLIAK